RAVRGPSLVIEDVPLAIERDLWISTDGSYKAAVKRWRVKTGARAALGGDEAPPDWSPAEPVTAVDLTPYEPVDRDTLRNIAIEASARLRDIDGLRHGEVRARAIDGRYYLVTSDGTRLAQPDGYAVIYAWADLLREDGVQVYDRRQWVARTAAEFPTLEVIADEVEAMGHSVVARSVSEPVEYYEGPVVFEGAAAADLVRYLATPEVCGTPPPPQAGRTYQQQTRQGPRIGRRLMPAGWSVVDDPGRDVDGLPGGFRFDLEGVSAQPVNLVDDGYVRDLLLTRVPRAERIGSNGHARGLLTGDWAARLSVWEVRADRNVSTGAFQRQVARTMKGAGLDRILVVRGLQAGKAGSLPRPTDAVWLADDGSEQPALSLQFSASDRRTLRDIVAAGGGQQVHPYLDAWSVSGKVEGDAGLPTVLIAPTRLLVEDLELVFPGPSERPHALPPPG
ncbi:MAG: metallopeptidase TldD-related protein, partial [Myxococcota bacterium]|nr:metallopeptidase TldD-related protein [Myxococcota bacterium]